MKKSRYMIKYIVVFLVIVVALTIAHMYINSVGYDEQLALFEEYRASFEKVAELLLSEIGNDDKVYLYLSSDESFFSSTDGEIQLPMDSDTLNDINSFSPYVFMGIIVSEKQVVFQYALEFVVFNGNGERLSKRDFCEQNNIKEVPTRMWHLSDDWYYIWISTL